MLTIQVGGRDEVLNIVRDAIWLNSGGHIGDALLGLLALDAKGWVQLLQAHLESLLHTKISLSDRAVFALLLCLELARLLDLADDLAALLGKVDTYGEEFSNADILVRFSSNVLHRNLSL